jgi:dTDP-4-dehydrorhamnose reductase
MNDTKAVVFGASGLIGSHLLRIGRQRGDQVIGTTFRQDVPDLLTVDVTERAAMAALIAEYRPKVVFFPAATPNVDLCEAEPALTRRTNVDAVRTVAEIAAEYECFVVFYSTDYLFDGSEGPYEEADPINPINEYGRQKQDAEDALREVLPDAHLIIRTTVVYGQERQGKNFLTRLIRTVRQGESLRVPDDQIGNPTLVDDLAEASWTLADMRAAGTYNVVGPDWIDRCAFAQEAARVFGLETELIHPVNTAELGQTAPRPLRAGLRPEKAQALLGRSLVGMTEGLHRVRSQF